MPHPPRLLKYKGESLPIDRWAERTGIPAATIRSRLKARPGDVAYALGTPPDPRFGRGGRPRADAPRPCPPLLRHQSGRAYVRWSSAGRRHTRYLGEWGSDEAKAGYRRFALAWADGGPVLPAGAGLTVAELIEAYARHARAYYRKGDKPTSEFHAIRAAGRALDQVAGDRGVEEVTAEDLRLVQRQLVGANLVRKTINRYAGLIVRMFSWGAAQLSNGRPLVPAAVLVQLQQVRGLAAGRTRARDNPPVRAVPWADVEKALPHLSPDPERRAVLEAAVRVQWLTGMRSSALLAMRPADLDDGREEWRYDVPAAGNKQAHRDGRLVYYLGPKAQEILRPLLTKCPPGRQLFALPPVRGDRWVEPDRDYYRRTIRAACRAAGVRPWHPHQLRHSRATELARIYESDADAAAAIGATPDVTREVYRDPSDAVRRRIARETG
jgi:integrase